jgi:DNA-binding XRE family transcriptional regulator
VIAAIGSEAEADPPGLQAGDCGGGSTAGTGGGSMKLSDLPALGEVIDRQCEDPEFREQWDRSAFAREVAARIVRFRADRGFTQTQLARAVGMQQSVIARLERGEQPPSLSTLAKITAGTGIVFHINVSNGAVAVTA